MEIHCLFLSGKWESSVAKRFFFFNVPSCMWEYSRFSDWEFPFVKCLAGGCRDDLFSDSSRDTRTFLSIGLGGAAGGDCL